MIWLIGWVVFGFLVGLIARAFVPGSQALGIFRTMMLGIAGSFVGGVLGYALQGGQLIQSSGWIGSVIGGMILLALSLRRSRSLT